MFKSTDASTSASNPQEWQCISSFRFKAPQEQYHKSWYRWNISLHWFPYLIRYCFSNWRSRITSFSGIRLSIGFQLVISVFQMVWSTNITSLTQTEKLRVVISGSIIGIFCPNSLSRPINKSKYWYCRSVPNFLPAISAGKTCTVTALIYLLWILRNFNCTTTLPFLLSFNNAPAEITIGAP